MFKTKELDSIILFAATTSIFGFESPPTVNHFTFLKQQTSGGSGNKSHIDKQKGTKIIM